MMKTHPYMTRDKRVGFIHLNDDEKMPTNLISIKMGEAMRFLNDGAHPCTGSQGGIAA